MTGADYHPANECQHPHFIRPVLFTFFEYGSEDLKSFVKENLEDVVWEDVEAFQAWLRISPGTNTTNPVKLYWWILKYWDRLPQ